MFMSAIIITLVLFFFLGLSYYGWGEFLATVLRVGKKTPDNPGMPIWLGWAFTLFLFQVLHLVFPLTAYVAIPTFLLGTFLSAPRLINWLKSFFNRYQPFPSLQIIAKIILAFLFLSISVWVASRAMLAPENYDSGLYQINTIRWINSYPIVPGLGNLHSRLAYNQSFFAYVAALNFYPFFGFGRSIANSFLFLLLIGTLFISLRSIFSRPGLIIKHPFHYAPDLYILPVIVFLALDSNGLASPTPDLTSTILQLIIFVELAHGVAEWREGQRSQNYRAFVIIILAATAVTIKLSNLVFSMVVMGIMLVYVWQTSFPRIREGLRSFLPVLAIISVWGVRGYILSGTPLFPSLLGYLPFTWAMPRSSVATEASYIFSWARQPNASPVSVLDNWNWFLPWLHQISQKIVSIVYPLELSGVACFLALITGILLFLRKRFKPGYLEWVIFLPLLSGLVYWFFTAPDLRFAHALFWLLPIGSAMVLLKSLHGVLAGRIFLVAFCIVYIGVNFELATSIFDNRYDFKRISNSGWYPVPEVPIIEKKTNSGMIVYLPEEGDQAWDAPLPSTPYFNAYLQLMIPGDISSGFTVRSLHRNSP
jgi:hypothetical protein